MIYISLLEHAESRRMSHITAIDLLYAIIWFIVNLHSVPTPVLELICTYSDTPSHVSFDQVYRLCRKMKFWLVFNFIDPVV